MTPGLSTMQIATANRLSDGAVVYLTPTGGWSEFIEDGKIVADDEAAEDLLETAGASVRGQIVIGPYLIDMIAEQGTLRPRRVREAIRATGPSIAMLPGREAERKDQYVRV